MGYQDLKRSIEIISAFNWQNKINPSDLRSTDPKQVRLEQLFASIGYKYLRKRSKEAKSTRYSITVRNLALRYLSPINLRKQFFSTVYLPLKGLERLYRWMKKHDLSIKQMKLRSSSGIVSR